MTDSRGALDITRQRLAISRELISRSRRHLRSAAHLERSGAAIAAAQRLIDRHTRPRGGGPRSSSATPPAWLASGAPTRDS